MDSIPRQGSGEKPSAPPHTAPSGDAAAQPICVAVAMEDPLLRCLLVERLSREADLKPTATAPEPRAIAEATAGAEQRVVVLDLVPGGPPASAAIEHLANQPDAPNVIALSADESEAAQLLAARHGARGFVARSQGPDALPAAIRAVSRGEVWFTRRLSERVFQEYHRLFRRVRDADRPTNCLSDRERDVLIHVARGLTNQQIADELFMSIHTVKLHVRHVLQKLRLPNRTEAAVFAVREGLAPAEPAGQDA